MSKLSKHEVGSFYRERCQSSFKLVVVAVFPWQQPEPVMSCFRLSLLVMFLCNCL